MCTTLSISGPSLEQKINLFVDHDATFVVHIQRGLIPEHMVALVHQYITPFQDLVNVVEVIFDWIDVPQPEYKFAAFCQEF